MRRSDVDRRTCEDHRQPAVGTLRSSRGGSVLVCKVPSCGDYYATSWAPAMPRLWCERAGGPLECMHERSNGPTATRPAAMQRCAGCQTTPGYDYLQGDSAVFVDLTTTEQLALGQVAMFDGLQVAEDL